MQSVVFATVVDEAGRQVHFKDMVLYLGDGKASRYPADIDGLAWLPVHIKDDKPG